MHTLVVNHVNQQSADAVGKYRACFLSAFVGPIKAIVTSTTTSDGLVAQATLKQDPSIVATSYTYLEVTTGNSKFITNGVVAGDTVRYQFTVDAFGDPAWTEYTVASVASETVLRVVAGSVSPITTTQKVEVHRTLSSSQVVTELNTKAASYNNTRVCYVWPDTINGSGVSQPGYFACAALAGLAGAVPSHQGLRNVALLGFDAVQRSTNYFTQSQLNLLSAGGVWVLTQASDGTVYTLWPTTTNVATTSDKEEMRRRNIDMISYAIFDVWAPYIGMANVTNFTIVAMQAKLAAMVRKLTVSSNVETLGPAIILMTVNSLAASTVYPDHIVANLTVVEPYPNNQNELTIIL